MREDAGTDLRRTLKIVRVASRLLGIGIALGWIGVAATITFDLGVLSDGAALIGMGADRAQLLRLSLLVFAAGASFGFGVVVLGVRGAFWPSGSARMNRLMSLGLLGVAAIGLGSVAVAGITPGLIRDHSVAELAPSAVHGAASLLEAFRWLCLVVGAAALAAWWGWIAFIVPGSERITRFLGVAVASVGALTVVAALAGVTTLALLGFATQSALLAAAGFALSRTFARITQALDEAEADADAARNGGRSKKTKRT